MPTSASDDVREVVRLEHELLATAARTSPDRLDELLDPGFVEIGASGRRWERASLIAALVDAPLPLDARLQEADVTALAEGVLLLTYRAEVEGRGSLRSSVWVRGGDGWRLRFHQGTPLPG